LEQDVGEDKPSYNEGWELMEF